MMNKCRESSRYLNDEIMLQIFNNLPHKSLVRFCIVSKQWLHLIADPSNPHSVYSSGLAGPTPLGLFYVKQLVSSLGWEPVASNTTRRLPFLPDPFLSLLEDGSLDIDASSNGYLLCHSPESWNYFVINPSSRQRVDLPAQLNLPSLHSYNTVGFECLVNPTASPLISAQFIVILSDPACITLQVFSSDQFQWKSIKLWYSNLHRSVNIYDSLGYRILSRSPSIAHHGVHYWFYYKLHLDFSNNARDDCCILIAFDQNSSQIWTVNLPSNSTIILAYDQMLCANNDGLFYGTYDRSNFSVDVYYRRQSYECSHDWELEYRVSFLELKEKYPELLFNMDLVYKSDIPILKGFHTRNPRMFFFIVAEELLSYEVDHERLIAHSHLNNHMFSYRYDTWHSYEGCSWPRSLLLFLTKVYPKE